MTETIILMDGTEVTLVPWALDETVQHAMLLRAAVLHLTAPLRGDPEPPSPEQGLAQLRQVLVPCLQDPSHAALIQVADLGPVLDALVRVNRLDRLLSTAMKLHLRFVQAQAAASVEP